MARTNAARETLSDEAMRDGNSFLQNRRQISSGSSTSIYLSRIHSLVLMLGLIIFVLGGTLVYVVLKPPAVPVQIVQPAPAAPPAAAAPDTVQVIVAREAIPAGAPIKAEALMIDKVAKESVPESAIPAAELPALLGQFAVTPIRARTPIIREDLTSNRAKAMAFDIPEGFRAVSITVDSRTGVEGFAKPGTSVDVLWFNNDSRGKQQVTTIVSQAKVLSVAGTTEEATKDVAVKGVSSGTTATLLVTKKQAQVIELARNLGALSLSLVGGTEKTKGGEGEDSISVNDIYSRKFEDNKPAVDGMLITYNPVTGEQEKRVLKDRAWTDSQSDAQMNAFEKEQYQRRIYSRAAQPPPQRVRRTRVLQVQTGQ